MRAHPIIEEDAQVASATLLEGEEMRKPATSSELTAAPGSPSTIPSFITPLTPPTIKPADSEATAQLHTHTRTHVHKPSCTMHDFQSGRVVHPGTSPPCLAPSLRASGAFAEDPDGAESTPAAKSACLSMRAPHTPVGAKHTPDTPPRKKPWGNVRHMCERAQTRSQIGSVDAHTEEAHVTASSTSRNRCAILGCASPINNGPTTPSLTIQTKYPQSQQGTPAPYHTRAPCAEVGSPPEGNPNATAPWPWTGTLHRGARPPPSRADTPQRSTTARRHRGLTAPCHTHSSSPSPSPFRAPRHHRVHA